MSAVVDLHPRPLDVTRLPLRRRVPPAAVELLVGTDPLLAPLCAPEITCDVEVTAPRPDGEPGRARLVCRHSLLGDRVASAAWGGGLVEVATYGIEHWQTELARAADVPHPADAAGTGRLTATVCTRADGTTRVGWVTWLLVADGWRKLTPAGLAPVSPMDLGAEVAALVALVRGRR
ncbi:MAG: hypothetical protein ABIO16_18625 [Nocardioides sp.]